jgi:hypothetical protein
MFAHTVLYIESVVQLTVRNMIFTNLNCGSLPCSSVRCNANYHETTGRNDGVYRVVDKGKACTFHTERRKTRREKSEGYYG